MENQQKLVEAAASLKAVSAELAGLVGKDGVPKGCNRWAVDAGALASDIEHALKHRDKPHIKTEATQDPDTGPATLHTTVPYGFRR